MTEDIALLAKQLPEAAVEAARLAGAQWQGGADHEFYARIVAAALPHLREHLLIGVRQSGTTWVDRSEIDLIMRRMAVLLSTIKNGAAPAEQERQFEQVQRALTHAFGLA